MNFVQYLHICLTRVKSPKNGFLQTFAPFLRKGIELLLIIIALCALHACLVSCLRRNLYQCPHDVKEAAYKGFVRPVLQYGRCDWDSQGVVLQKKIEKKFRIGLLSL